MINSLTFGVELECLIPSPHTMYSAAQKVAEKLGSPCHVTSYSNAHRTVPAWKVTTDGSVSGVGTAAEFVSPILSGENGLKQAELVCEALTEMGCRVNTSCGLHVHVGVRNEPVHFFKKIAKFYNAFEQVIDSMMPPSRRAGTSTYCRSLATMSLDGVERATTVEGVLHAISGERESFRGANEDYRSERWWKLNLAAYFRHKTIEFRQHSGTVDKVKVKNWIVTCLKMVAAMKRETVPALHGIQQVNKARAGSAARRVGDMMLREEGVTRSEALAATGWPAISLPQQAGMCGLTFTTVRTGRTVRYFATPQMAFNLGAAASPAVEAAPEISIAGFAKAIGASPDELSYYRNRVHTLNGGAAE